MTAPTVDIVIPVYNEEHSLLPCLDHLLPFCRDRLSDYSWHVVIADNGSIDGTYQQAFRLHLLHPDEVEVVHLDLKGRGRALKRTWQASDAEILCYMDVDLSTHLEALPTLLDAIGAGYDLATGSRLKAGAHTSRSFKREVVSRSYNLIVKGMFRTGFSDAQCGFKAINHLAAQELLPLVQNNNWFFDSELLIVAEKMGYRIADIPVTWAEDTDTRVKVFRTAMEDLLGLLRLRLGGIPKK